MAVRDEDVAFARRLRVALARSDAAESMTPHELARAEARVLHAMRGGGVAALITPRLVALGAAAAVCVVWFAGRPGLVPKGAPATAAFSLDVPSDGHGLRKLELEALLKNLPGDSTAPAPMLVADFNQVDDLARVTFIGGGVPSLSVTSRAGRRSLRAMAGPPDNPSEIIITVPARLQGMAVQTVSAWVLAKAGAAEVALVPGDGPASARQVEPGGWRWVTFSVPETPLTEVHLRLTGTGVVLIDQVELWCKGASHGG